MAAAKKKPVYKVAEGTQVHHQGVTYEGGQTVPLDPEADAADLAYWLNAGWIEAQ